MTLKKFIDYFQQGLNDSASTLIAIEETMHIMKEEHNAEINIYLLEERTMRKISDQRHKQKKINKVWVQFLSILFLIRLGKR